MLFIHGGGFVAGSKDATVHDGTAFAASGAVCVAINYRMGIDGFLPVPGAPTNLGLRDILFALAWVQRNVSAFGGDRAKIGRASCRGSVCRQVELSCVVASVQTKSATMQILLEQQLARSI